MHIFRLVANRHALERLIALKDDRPTSNQDCAILCHLISLPWFGKVFYLHDLSHWTEFLLALFIFRLRQRTENFESQTVKCQINNSVAFSFLAGLDNINQVIHTRKWPALNVVNLLAVMDVPLEIKHNIYCNRQELGLRYFFFHKDIVLFNEAID